MRKFILLFVSATMVSAGLFFHSNQALGELTDSGRYIDQMTSSSFVIPEGWDVKNVSWTDGYIEPGIIQLNKDGDMITIRKVESNNGLEASKQELQKIAAEYTEEPVIVNSMQYDHLVSSFRGEDGTEGTYEGYFLSRESKNYAIELYSRFETYPANKDAVMNLVNSFQYQ